MSRQTCAVFDVKNIRLFAYEISKPQGLRLPENFPDCCIAHRQVVRETEEYLEQFPNCCDKHKEVAKRFNLSAKNFQYLKHKVVYQLEYTGQFIEHHIDTGDWYKKITHYIDLNVGSFGVPAIGLNLYIHFLKQDIEKHLNISDETKIKKLLSYFDANNQTRIKDFVKDINLLQNAYAKWLKFFPFDLPYFHGLKKNFSATMPILNGKPEYNPYSQTADAKLINQKQLIAQLVGVTKKLLALISSKQWLEKNSADDNKKLEIKLTTEAHRVAQSSLVNDFTKNEKKYVKTIKEWLQNEKTFFAEMKSILQKKPARPPKQIAFYYKGDQGCLGDALEALHNLNAISQEIKLPRFKKLFNGKPVSEPINWEGDEGDLKTFIKNILKSPNLECPYQQHWNITVQCFTLNNQKLKIGNLKGCEETKKEIHFKRAAKNLR